MQMQMQDDDHHNHDHDDHERTRHNGGEEGNGQEEQKKPARAEVEGASPTPARGDCRPGKTTPGNACPRAGIDAPETEEAGEIGDERRDDNEREYAHLRFGATPKPAGYFLKTETSH